MYTCFSHTVFHQNKCPTQKNKCIHVSKKLHGQKMFQPFFPSTMKIHQSHWFTGPPATSLRPLRWTLVAPQWNPGGGTTIDPATGTRGTCSTCFQRDFHLVNKHRNSMIEVKTGLQIMHCRTYYVHPNSTCMHLIPCKSTSRWSSSII